MYNKKNVGVWFYFLYRREKLTLKLIVDMIGKLIINVVKLVKKDKKISMHVSKLIIFKQVSRKTKHNDDCWDECIEREIR